MEFTFKVHDSEGSDEFIRFIETLDFVEPISSNGTNPKRKSKPKKARSKKSSNIIPAKNPNGDPLMLTGAFDHVKDIKKWRESVWRRK